MQAQWYNISNCHSLNSVLTSLSIDVDYWNVHVSSWTSSFRQAYIAFFSFLKIQEYNVILVKRIQQLQKIRHRPNQFTILVREIPFCPEHNARGCYVDHFFSKHHPYSYHSYQMLYDGKDVEVLLVRL